MEKITSFIIGFPVISFLIITFLISLISFLLMFIVPNANSPENITGLPVWLIAIWSPNIAAIVIWLSRKELVSNLHYALSIPSFSWWFLIVLIPLIVAAIILLTYVMSGNSIDWSNFKIEYILPLLFINLFLGPLGEELGWRAYLYPKFTAKYGWMASALIVGIIWAIWHSPLWLLDSPQSKIPFGIFLVNVVLLSVLMSIVYNHSQGSIIYIILLHLTFNFSLGIIDLLGSHTQDEFASQGLFVYLPLVIILVYIHELTAVKKCLIE